MGLCSNEGCTNPKQVSWYNGKYRERATCVPCHTARLRANRQRYPSHGRQTPEQKAARAAVKRAIKNGDLVRTPCRDCGAEPAQAHHHKGYAPEHAIDVVFLCQRCHGRAEREMRSKSAATAQQ